MAVAEGTVMENTTWVAAHEANILDVYPRDVNGIQRATASVFQLYYSCHPMFMFLGGIGYVLARELLMPGGTYPIIDQTVSRLSGNPEVRELLGGTELAVFGMGDGRSRRRPIVHQSLLEDGRKMVDAAFYVQGTKHRAQVTLQAVEREDGQWEERYLALDIPGQPRKILIQPVIKRSDGGWHPFSSWFARK